MINVLFQLCSLLFGFAAVGLRDRDVGRAVKNVLAIYSALAQSRPTFGIVVVGVWGVYWRCGDVILKSSKVGKNLGNPCRSVFVNWVGC